MGTILKNGISYSGSGGGGSGVSSYNELTDKPSINNVTLTGNKTTSDLGIATSDACYTTDDAAETTLADNDYFPFQDVSASGKRKTLWSNIKSVLKTYFDSIYNAKLTAGANISISSNTISASLPVMGTFSKGELYSTSEKLVGCWTDGRPVYKKTVSCGAGPNKTTKTVSHGISYFKECVYIETIGGGSGYYWTLNYSGNGQDVLVYVDSSKVYLSATDDQSPCSYIVTLYYTKTSDSANSYNYASENDYSTSEKIIGTWVDGSTLYQRSFTGTFPSSISNGAQISIATFSSSYYIREAIGASRWKDGSSVGSVCLPFFDGSSGMAIQTNSGSGKLEFYCAGNTLYPFNNQPYSVTVKYTK